MKISVPKERRPDERRVAASPDTVKRLAGQGHELLIESGAGDAASFLDDAYQAAGAHIARDMAEAMGAGDIVLKVQRPLPDELKAMRRGAVLIGMLAPLQYGEDVPLYAGAGIASFAMELVPRITRAQAMDVLSSQANLSGYRIVLDAAHAFGRAMPMMMPAGGTIAPARVLVMGAGVAGLQAIATARRLGAIVSATDVRFAAKEQVESLGATFLAVDLEAMKAMETAGGYAKEMGEDFARRQREHVSEAMKKIDIVITTALVPGRRAPVLITAAMMANLRTGLVVADLRGRARRQCRGQQAGRDGRHARRRHHPRSDQRAVAHPGRCERALCAQSDVAFLGLIIDKEKNLKIDTADEIVKASLLTQDGAVVHPQFAPAPARARAAGD